MDYLPGMGKRTRREQTWADQRGKGDKGGVVAVKKKIKINKGKIKKN